MGRARGGRNVTDIAGSEFWGLEVEPERIPRIEAYLDRIRSSLERRKKEGRQGDGNLTSVLEEEPYRSLAQPVGKKKPGLIDSIYTKNPEWLSKRAWASALNEYLQTAERYGIDLLGQEKPSWLQLAETQEEQWLAKSPLDRFRAIETDRSDLLIRNWQETLSAIPAGSHCLDIGCGSGFFVREAQKNYPSLHWQAADLDRDMPINGTEWDRTKELWFSRCERNKPLPFRDASMDVITLNNVLHHVEPKEVRPFLKEVARVLKPGGKLLVTEEYENETAPIPEMIDGIYWRNDRGHQVPLQKWVSAIEKGNLFKSSGKKVAPTFGTPGLPVLEECLSFERQSST